VDGVAEGVVRLAAGQQALRGKEVDEALADRVDAGLVVAAAVGVHRVAQQVEHGILLAGEPAGDLGFSRGQCGHINAPEHAFFGVSSCTLVTRVAPRHRGAKRRCR